MAEAKFESNLFRRHVAIALPDLNIHILLRDLFIFLNLLVHCMDFNNPQSAACQRARIWALRSEANSCGAEAMGHLNEAGTAAEVASKLPAEKDGNANQNSNSSLAQPGAIDLSYTNGHLEPPKELPENP